MGDAVRYTFFAGWEHMDFNAHMANAAYLDIAVNARMRFFTEHGFSMRALEKHGIGPVVRRDELDYFREFRLLEPIHVELALAGLSPDGSRMKLRNVFYRDDGAKAAVLTSFGGWLDLRERRLTVPLQISRDVLAGLPRTDDYEDLKGLRV
ncbi:MAG: thioesterase family protein [Deltaproteobacteria bacterium]|nr:thioesterase family protein [Deltaproteobacteria bacterium]